MILQHLRDAGHDVYDFRNPVPGENGFSWSEIEPDWLQWNAKAFTKALEHPIAEHGFQRDWQAMLNADAGVLLLPCGRSAHLEAGYFVGAGKLLFILLIGENEPELMYKMATAICHDTEELLSRIATILT